MPSLTNRPNGVPASVYKGTYGRIVLQPDKPPYRIYRELRSDDKVTMDALLELMQSDSNHLILSADTANAMSDSTGYTIASIRNSITRLVEVGLVYRAILPNELIVSPTFAFKGNETEVWKFIQAVEYHGNIPREGALTDTISEWSNK